MNSTLIEIDRSCPDIGVWRAWLDQEDHSPSIQEHLSSCPGCQRLVADLREQATGVRESLSVLAPRGMPSAADIAVARERLEWRLRARSAPARRQGHGRLGAVPTLLTRASTPWRVGAGGLAAALVLTLLVAFTPEGNAAAASFLAQFRSEKLAVVEVTHQTQGEIMKTLNALSNLGTVTMSDTASQVLRPDAAARNAAEQTRTVSLAEASRIVRFSLETPDPATLPAGVDKTPVVHVKPASEVRFTFDKAKARAYFQSTGHPEVSLPDKFDGATMVVSVPAAAVLEYGGSGSKEALLIGEADELVVNVEGGKLSLNDMRDFILSLPGLQPSVVNQFKQIQNWNQTLPLPVPVDTFHWQSTTIKGNQGLVLDDNSGVGSAAVWHANGHLFGVAGSLKSADIQRIANSLAVR